MAPPQQFCLKWNNHTTNMLSVFENLLATEALVDVTLACDGLSLKAHKMVLSACSPFFQSLFIENPCKHPIVIMKDMKYNDLKAIVDFMYSGEVNVAQDRLAGLLKTAETLKVKGLADVKGTSGNDNSESTPPSGGAQEVVQPPPPTPPVQRTDTPPVRNKRKRARQRRHSSDSNYSDDEAPPKIKEQPRSPDIEELSGDNMSSVVSDVRSRNGPVATSGNTQQSLPTIPAQQTLLSSTSSNSFSITKSLQNMSQDPVVEEPASCDDSEFELEPAKLMEQTLTTGNVSSNTRSGSGTSSKSFPSGLEVSRRGSSTNSQALVPTSTPSDPLVLEGPDSPEDIKPQLLSFDDQSNASGTNDASMMMYMDQSGVVAIPGPSNYQDNSSLVPQDSQSQGKYKSGLPAKNFVFYLSRKN